MGNESNFNGWCASNKCEQYIEWPMETGVDEQPYMCISCKLQGQSYDIDSIAEDCPFEKPTK